MLQIKNLTKIYKGNKKAVDNVSIHVEKGDIYGFIGHNGAGKTTTIKSVMSILNFEEGEILIDGISIKKDPIEAKKIMAYIPDNPDIYENLTAIQYINFISDIYMVDPKRREELLEKYATLFEIKSSLGEQISSFSHGMKQKLVIIAALIHEPKLLVLDEPFVGLDPKASFELKNIMKEMCEKGTAIFFSTHVLEVAQKLCNKVSIIKEGKIILSGKTSDVIGDKSLEDVFMELENE